MPDLSNAFGEKYQPTASETVGLITGAVVLFAAVLVYARHRNARRVSRGLLRCGRDAEERSGLNSASKSDAFEDGDEMAAEAGGRAEGPAMVVDGALASAVTAHVQV